jgi:hypothetical protein
MKTKQKPQKIWEKREETLADHLGDPMLVGRHSRKREEKKQSKLVTVSSLPWKGLLSNINLKYLQAELTFWEMLSHQGEDEDPQSPQRKGVASYKGMRSSLWPLSSRSESRRQ